MQNEWVQQAEDLLYRRTKLGLVLSDDEQVELSAYLEENQQQQL